MKRNAEHGMSLLAATLQGSLWSRWRAHMVLIGPWRAFKMAWRHRRENWNDLGKE